MAESDAGERSFTTKQAAQLTQCEEQLLDQWAKRRFLVPSIRADVGRGKSRLYSFGDLVSVQVVRALQVGGIDLKFLAPAVRYVQGMPGLWGLPDGVGLFIKTDGTVWHGTLADRNEAARALKPREFIVQVGLSMLVDTVRTEIDLADGGPGLGNRLIVQDEEG